MRRQVHHVLTPDPPPPRTGEEENRAYYYGLPRIAVYIRHIWGSKERGWPTVNVSRARYLEHIFSDQVINPLPADRVPGRVISFPLDRAFRFLPVVGDKVTVFGVVLALEEEDTLWAR